MTEDAQAAVRFRVTGTMRFLSHAETARVLQRACARAGLPVRYSQGFNPHPRLSLPLPRPVGVESDEELLVVRLEEDRAGASPESRTQREATVKRALAEQLPDGIDVQAVHLAPAHASWQPRSAEYVLPVQVEEAGGEERLRSRIAEVMESDRCMVQRGSGEDGSTRTVDVRPFLDAVRWEDGNLVVRHRTGPGGSIRVDEIRQLFGLRPQEPAGPVRRTHVIWETKELQNSAKEPRTETGAEDVEDGT
jgi:radical SAM-linked protein